MNPSKIAAQCVHAAMGIGHDDYDMSIVVLKVSDKKFREVRDNSRCFVVEEAGYTDVEPNTETCLAYYEE